MNKIINVGIIGFGLSGRFFFSPYIQLHPSLNLSAIVSSQHALVKKEYPGAKVYSNAEELINDKDIDVIVISSPNKTHFDYAKKVLEANKHVIIEKPFDVSTKQGETLIQLAKEKGKFIIPFQNRRWDGDFLTVQKLISESKLGDVLELESHFDRFRPNNEGAEWKLEDLPGNGIVYNLATHLIDQALVLFGKPQYIYACICKQRSDARVDDNFEIQLIYSTLKVTLKAGSFVRKLGPRFSIIGRNGSFIKFGLDPQEENLVSGMKPNEKGIGRDRSTDFGKLYFEKDGQPYVKIIETVDGNYMPYFENVYRALIGEEELIVKPEQAKMVIEIIEKAYQSSQMKQVVPMI